METAIISRIAQDVGITETQIGAVIALLEKGATAPFIARYRKEATGGVDGTKLQVIQERLTYYQELVQRRNALIRLLADQGKLTDDLRARIEGLFTRVEVEDLFYLVKPRKRSRAAEAREKGLEPLAEYLWNQEPDAWGLEEHADVFIVQEKKVANREEALQGALDIIAEWIADNIDIRKGLREMLWQEGYVVSTVVPAKAAQKTKYSMYYNRREQVATIPSHRVLAIRRGTKEGILTSAIEGDNNKALELIRNSVIRDKESVFVPFLELAIRESYNHILRPMIETEVRAQLKERADREAIRVFQENLSNLLLSPPAGPMIVLGLDPGKGGECRLAVIDETGSLLETASILTKPPRMSQSAEKKAPEQPSAPPPSPETSPEASAEPTTAEPSGAVEPVPDQQPAIKTAPGQEIPMGEMAASEATMPAEENAAAEQALPIETPAESAAVEQALPIETPAENAAVEQALPVEIPAENSAVEQALPIEAPAENAAAEQALPVEIPAESAPEPPEEPSAPEDAMPLPIPSVEEPPVESALIPPSPEVSAPAESQEVQALPESVPQPVEPEVPAEAAMLTSLPTITPMDQPPAEENPPVSPTPPFQNYLEAAHRTLADLIAKQRVQALAIGSGAGARELEIFLRQILAEEKIENVVIASVNDAGVAIYASSRAAREEFPDLNVSTRCAISLARRLQDPMAELVKIDPKLIGVGQYQHDVDQKELHRALVQTVQYCVNHVGVQLNSAGYSLLRYVSGLNDKLARKIVSIRNAKGNFASRASFKSLSGIDPQPCEQAQGFLRIRGGENPLDCTAIHPESYPVVEKMAAACGVGIAELVGNSTLVPSIKLADYAASAAGLHTLTDIRNELLKPGRDPRRTFAAPKFRADIKSIGDLKEGMTLEGTVTNVTNFGAFVDIGVQQDGLVHLSQMSSRFIRDPREAVKVGDVVQVKVISVEVETKRIGLSMKALMPQLAKQRKKPRRRIVRGSTTEAGGAPALAGGPGDTAPHDSDRTGRQRPPGRRERSGPRGEGERPYRDRRQSRRPDRPREHREPPKEVPSEPKEPERTLQEKIAILQSKFRGIG